MNSTELWQLIVFIMFTIWVLWMNFRNASWYKKIVELLRKLKCKYKSVNTYTAKTIQDIFLVASVGGVDIELVDDSYLMYREEDYKDFLSIDEIDQRGWSSFFDCDNFAFILYGEVKRYLPQAAFGVLLAEISPGKYHAVNCFINEYSKIKIVEPQDDKIFDIPGSWKIYFVLM